MIIWAFPGMGKSYAALNNSESIFDCDATRFKYDVNPDTNLHGSLPVSYTHLRAHET